MSEDKHFDMLKGIQHIITLPHNHIFKNQFFYISINVYSPS